VILILQPLIRPFVYNLQQRKDPPGLAGRASSNAQVSRESKRE